MVSRDIYSDNEPSFRINRDDRMDLRSSRQISGSLYQPVGCGVAQLRLRMARLLFTVISQILIAIR